MFPVYIKVFQVHIKCTLHKTKHVYCVNHGTITALFSVTVYMHSNYLSAHTTFQHAMQSGLNLKWKYNWDGYMYLSSNYKAAE